MNGQYLDSLIEQLHAHSLVARLIETGHRDLVEPLLLYTSADEALDEKEKQQEFADLAALDDARFDRSCRSLKSKYDLIERDALTGLYNRRKLNLDLDIVLNGVLRSSYRRNGQAPAGPQLHATFVLLDIDHFKDVNDRYGHAYGDTVLQEVGSALIAAIRTTDRQRVYRYGGEEKALLLFPSAPESAYLVGERLRNAVLTHTQSLGLCDGRGVTASFGISTTQTACDRRTLVGQADLALYCAKKLGRNRVEAYSPV